MGQGKIGRKHQLRLAYLENRLYFFGELRRSDIIDYFDVAPACATRDIAAYRAMAPDNLAFDQSSKTYKIGQNFTPYFQHSPEQVLASLANGFGDVWEGACESVSTLTPGCLQILDVDVLSVISRSIFSGKAVRLKYLSRSSGETDRVIVPHALVSSGFRWHVRAFDRKRSEFRDFVLSRVMSATLLENFSVKNEGKEQDVDWNRMVELAFVPHPQSINRNVIAQDYRMRDGCLKVCVRSAVLGYFLRYWNVDCSATHELNPLQYELCLANPLSLYGVPSAVLAPGYRSDDVA